MLVRGGRLVSRRTCIELTWAKLVPGKDIIHEGPRGLPKSMPKFPHSREDKDSAKRERPYHNYKDYEVWEKDFREFLATHPEEVTDASGVPYEQKPYHGFEAFERYKERLQEMPEEEKKLLGHTIKAERAKPCHEVFGKQFRELEECAVILRRSGDHLDKPPRGVTQLIGSHGNFINEERVSDVRAEAVMFKDKPVDHMQELRDAIAARKAGKEEESEAEKLSS